MKRMLFIGLMMLGHLLEAVAGTWAGGIHNRELKELGDTIASMARKPVMVRQDLEGRLRFERSTMPTEQVLVDLTRALAGQGAALICVDDLYLKLIPAQANQAVGAAHLELEFRNEYVLVDEKPVALKDFSEFIASHVTTETEIWIHDGDNSMMPWFRKNGSAAPSFNPGGPNAAGFDKVWPSLVRAGIGRDRIYRAYLPRNIDMCAPEGPHFPGCKASSTSNASVPFAPEPSATITEYGRYTSSAVKKHTLAEQTTIIPARIGEVFGMCVMFGNLPKDYRFCVSQEMSHPAFQEPNGSVRTHHVDVRVFDAGSHPEECMFFGWKFLAGYEYELVPGSWTCVVKVNNKEVASKTFEVRN
jgi:hypothetical protein